MKFATPIVRFALILAASFQLISCGGGGSSVTPPPPPPPSSMALFAGNVAGPSNLDGVGSVAGFNGPMGVAIGSNGTVFVADTENSTIRKIVTAAGVSTVSTFAGTAGVVGTANGPGTTARFNEPSGITVDGNDNVYVADTGNNTIRKITALGAVSTLAGSGIAGSDDGIGSAASFNNPTAIAVSSDGDVYVADSGNNAIRKIVTVTVAGVSTTTVSTFAGSAAGIPVSLNNPGGLAVDNNENVYVADTGNHIILMITQDGGVSTLAGMLGSPEGTDGDGAAARFYRPSGIAVDSAGSTIFVADAGNNSMRKIVAVGSANTVSTVAGSTGVVGSADGNGIAASFSGPNGVAMDSTGSTIVVADTGNSTIRKIVTAGSVNTVSTLAGTASVTGSQDGNGVAASFNNPYGIANDSAGSIYVADTNNNTIRKISPQGTVSTLAGTAGITGNDNGTGVDASFSYPYNIAVDSAGNIYVADNGNNIIRKITSSGVVSTLAGTAGVIGNADGTGPGASFNGPTGIAVDSAGNVYVADTQNNIVRKITPAGVVTTPAWASASTANFLFPYGIAIDSTGTIYVSDNGHNVIRKITSAGVVTTLAGTAGVTGSADGTGPSASFNSPSGIALNSAGDVYVADTGNNTVRKITSAGVVSTVVGVAGQRGYRSGTLPGLLASPTALAISGTSLYIIVNNGVVVVQNVP